MPEHDGIIKLESLLVKSMDEWEIYRVALRSKAVAPAFKSFFPEIIVDRIPFAPYNHRQFKASNEL
jgi:hypothetical protein